MAIQMRRGLKKDFDPEKMLPGEWSVSIDPDTNNQIVWMCFAPGVVKRMSTYEDFTAQIEAMTETINTATTNATNAAQAAEQAAEDALTAKNQANSARDYAVQAANHAASVASGASSAATQATNAAETANQAATAANAAAAAAIGAENVNISAIQTLTGADITVTDRTGAETTVHIDTITAINGWNDVKNAVRMGLGEKLFPVGYEFTTHDSSTDSDITWVVVAHDHHTAANTHLTHTMTLETKQVYSNNQGAYFSFAFDAPEALYYATDGLAAGTYNFTLLSGHDTSHGGGKTLSFTLTNPVPAGGIIMFPWGENKQSTDVNISTYADQTSTDPIETVSVTESAAGTNLGTADGSTPGMNHTQRIRFGSNNYAQSAVRQWLNSGADTGEVWQPSTVFDRPPAWAATRAGFMNGLPADFLTAVEPAAVPCRTNSIFEAGSLDGTEFAVNQLYTLKDRFFIPSRPEIYGTWDSASLKDGEQLEYYSGLTNAERIKYDASGTVRHYWMRSPASGTASNVNVVYSGGALNNTNSKNTYGIAPACIIA